MVEEIARERDVGKWERRIECERVCVRERGRERESERVTGQNLRQTKQEKMRRS
jgi:hypothetical protein